METLVSAPPGAAALRVLSVQQEEALADDGLGRGSACQRRTRPIQGPSIEAYRWPAGGRPLLSALRPRDGTGWSSATESSYLHLHCGPWAAPGRTLAAPPTGRSARAWPGPGSAAVRVTQGREHRRISAVPAGELRRSRFAPGEGGNRGRRSLAPRRWWTRPTAGSPA